MIDAFFSILFGIPFLIAWTMILWWALVSHVWYLMLIPAYIGGGVSLYQKNPKWFLIGLATSWVGSWIIAFIAIFCVRID